MHQNSRSYAAQCEGKSVSVQFADEKWPEMILVFMAAQSALNGLKEAGSWFWHTYSNPRYDSMNWQIHRLTKTTTMYVCLSISINRPFESRDRLLHEQRVPLHGRKEEHGRKWKDWNDVFDWK